jgi:hypothetical protein
MGAALVASLAASLAERPRRPLDDNIRVVVAVAIGITLWRFAFP